MLSAVNHRFFYAIVDVNSNKLVLAVFTYRMTGSCVVLKCILGWETF